MSGEYNIVHRIMNHLKFLDENLGEAIEKDILIIEQKQDELICSAEEIRDSIYELLELKVPGKEE